MYFFQKKKLYFHLPLLFKIPNLENMQDCKYLQKKNTISILSKNIKNSIGKISIVAKVTFKILAQLQSLMLKKV